MGNEYDAIGEALKSLLQQGELCGYVTTDSIVEILGELDDSKMSLVRDYFASHRIGVDAPLDVPEMDEEEQSYFHMFLEDIKELPKTDYDTKKLLIRQVLDFGENGTSAAANSEAIGKLTQAYLPMVVDVSRLYTGQGVILPDLISEANLALVMALNSLPAMLDNDTPEGADLAISRYVMKALEEYVAEETDSEASAEKALNTVIAVTDKAKELSEEYMRKVTIDELAMATKLSRKKILEAIRISKDCYEYIEKPEIEDE